MDIETILISVLGSLGISGLIGIYLQHLWTQKREIESKIQSLNVKHYELTLVFMRIVLDPKKIDHFNVAREDPVISRLTNAHEIGYFARNRLIEFYYTSVLFYSDEVLNAIKEFLQNATEDTFMKTAVAMRKDLWKKKTKIDSKMLSLE
jgi:hypothetical protein